MVTAAVPYHLDRRLAAFDVGTPVDRDVVVELPAGDAWHRMSALYEQVAHVVASYPNRVPIVVSGDLVARDAAVVVVLTSTMMQAVTALGRDPKQAEQAGGHTLRLARADPPSDA